MPSDSEPRMEQPKPLLSESDAALAGARRLAELREGAVQKLKAELARLPNQAAAASADAAVAVALTDAPAPGAAPPRAAAAQMDAASPRVELTAGDASLADLRARLESQAVTLAELQRVLSQREVALASALRVAELRSGAAQRLQAELARLRDRPAADEPAVAAAGQRAADAERRLEKALAERAQADAALARAQMEAALRGAAAEKAFAEAAALREELATKDAIIARISDAGRLGEAAAGASDPHPGRSENTPQHQAAEGGAEGLIGFGAGDVGPDGRPRTW